MLSEGCGRHRRPCPRLLHSEPIRLAVVTAFSLKFAAARGLLGEFGALRELGGAMGVVDHRPGVASTAA